MTYKVIVTGSRDLKNFQAVYDALDEVWVAHQPLMVIHGSARGADSYADTWAVFRPHVTVVRVPADWENDGNAAGPIRNGRMLELGPDLVLAFFQTGAANRGTQHMTNLARDRGVEVRTYQVD